MERLVPVDAAKQLPTLTREVNTNMVASTRPIIARVNYLNALAAQDIDSGISAGQSDGNLLSGVWSNIFYSFAEQKMHKEIPGYKSSSFGGIVGIDFALRETSTVGFALSYVDGQTKYKNQKLGDKTKTSTTILSLYGMEYITKNWFAQGFMSYGMNDVKKSEQRILSTGASGIAKAKYKPSSFSIGALGGYNYVTKDYLITPQAGFNFTNIDKVKYNESGINNLNLFVSQKVSNALEGIVGIRASKEVKVSNLTIVPELHGFLNYDFIAKTGKSNARLTGMVNSLPVNNDKTSRLTLNIGANVTMHSNMMEYQLEYDIYILNKFIGNQVAVKARINF